MLKLHQVLHASASGRVEVSKAPRSRPFRIAYVPQAELVDWDFPVTVEDVVMMGRYAAIGIGRRAGPADQERVDAALATVSMTHMRKPQIGRLSEVNVAASSWHAPLQPTRTSTSSMSRLPVSTPPPRRS